MSRCSAKKLQKQLDKTTLQLTESRSQIRDLKLQLSDAGDCKVSNALSRRHGNLKPWKFIHVLTSVNFVGKGKENRRSREAPRRIGNVANAFFAKSHRAQRTGTNFQKNWKLHWKQNRMTSIDCKFVNCLEILKKRKKAQRPSLDWFVFRSKLIIFIKLLKKINKKSTSSRIVR